nr:7-cyano-7-deazaguanine synthase [Candidatus Sigynarchaeota archaeon]
MGEEYWFRQLKANGKGYLDRIDTIKKILIDTRGYVFEKPENEPVIILFSGGMDSTTLIDLVIKQWQSKVILLYFRRDSRNQTYEEQAVDFFHEFYKKRYPNNILELLKLDIQIPSRVNKEYMDNARKKVMGLPMRNATMWANAFTQAIYMSGKYTSTIRTVLCGSVAEDSSSPESGYLSVISGCLHACICLGVWNLQLNAPLMDNSLKVGGMTKKDLVEYCKAQGIPLEKSRSCFGDTKEPCGECLACKYREAAFKAVK